MVTSASERGWLIGPSPRGSSRSAATWIWKWTSPAKASVTSRCPRSSWSRPSWAAGRWDSTEGDVVTLGGGVLQATTSSPRPSPTRLLLEMRVIGRLSSVTCARTALRVDDPREVPVVPARTGRGSAEELALAELRHDDSGRRGRRDVTSSGVEVAGEQVGALPKGTDHHDRLVVEPLDEPGDAALVGVVARGVEGEGSPFDVLSDHVAATYRCHTVDAGDALLQVQAHLLTDAVGVVE